MNNYEKDILINAAQNSQAWDIVRRGRFTGSGLGNLFKEPRSKADKDAGNFGETAKTYIIEKAMEVITGRSLDNARGPAIDHGNEWEEHAIRYLAKEIGCPDEELELKPRFKVYGEYSGASPDAYMKYLGHRVGAETKCPFNPVNHYYHSLVTDGPSLKECNPDYYWQIQANIFFHKYPLWLFASFDPFQPEHKRLHYAEIYANPQDIELMLLKMEKAEAMKQEIIKDWMNKV